MNITEQLIKQREEFESYLISKGFDKFSAGYYTLYETYYVMDEWFEEREFNPYRNQVYNIEIEVFKLGKVIIKMCDCHVGCCGKLVYEGEGTKDKFIKELEKFMLDDLDYVVNNDVRKEDIDKMIEYYTS